MQIQIYPSPILEYRTWQEAEDLCQQLGEGWRLPTPAELDFIHQLGKDGKIPLGNFGCWGELKDNEYAWSKGFHTGNIYLNPLDNLNYVLPVRDI